MNILVAGKFVLTQLLIKAGKHVPNFTFHDHKSQTQSDNCYSFIFP